MGSRIPGTQDKVYLNFKGMGELLKSKEIESMLMERMAVVQAAIPGSILESRPRRTRIAAIVKNGSDFDEANTGELSRALDLSGGQRGTQVKLKKPKRGATNG